MCLTGMLLLSAVSCKKGFIDLNKDPNTSEFALPKTLLAPALTAVVKQNMQLAQDINNELMQVHIITGGTKVRVFRYDLAATLSVTPYNSWYLQLVNFRDLYTSASGRLKIDATQTYNKTYMGIALICDAWVMSLLTDTFGDLPDTEAGKVKEQILLPKFDAQKDIYTRLFAKLEEANTLLTANANLPADQITSDPLYAGNAVNWRKFGNSLYLRLLMRASGKTEANAPVKIAEIVADPVKYPVIGSNAESAILKWTGTAPYDSPFATSRDADWNGLKLTEFFVNNLKNWNDPRIAKWATLFNGEYGGMPGGYPSSENPPAKSTMPLTLRTNPLLGNIINYSEVQFILAEAASRGWSSGSAKTYYENGITSHMALWGVVQPAGYLTSPVIAWNDADGLGAKLEKIHLQKYYSMYATDFQQWFEFRRTGHPILPTGAGLMNGGKMPSRMLYPAYLQSTNKANLDAAVAIQGADNMNTLVWWQRP